jgi:phosphoglycolate phosphatase-like HAD superfamily hydrolase
VFRATALREAPRVPAFPGIHTSLARLDKRGVKLGVVTSKARSQTAWTLAQFDVEFASVQTPESGCPGKPAPFPLLVAASEAQVDVRDAVFVGDMDVDCAAARAARMRFLHAGWGYGACLEGGASLRHPRELGELGASAPLAA